MKNIILFISIVLLTTVISCKEQKNTNNTNIEVIKSHTSVADKLALWKEVKLNSDISFLSENQKLIVKKLIKASEIIDSIYWKQVYPYSIDSLLSEKDSLTLQYIKLNYGPWDRLDGNKPFVKGIGEKPIGRNFYPLDMKYLPFMAYELPEKLSPVTMIRRDSSHHFIAIPYNIFFHKELQKAANYILEAANISNNESFKNYLKLKAQSLLDGECAKSDIAWLNTKNNLVDFLVEPAEAEDDDFLGIKKSYEGYVLVKDTQLTKKTQEYISYTKEMQKAIPCNEIYKKNPKTNKINIIVYNVLYYTGYANCSAKNISINRPYNPDVLKTHGSCKLIFENVTEAKYNSVLKPLSNLIIDKTQANSFDEKTFFESNVLYEIGDKLDFDKTLSGEPIVNKLKDKALLIDKIRADLLRIYLVPVLAKNNLISPDEVKKHYVCYLSNLFRIARFGYSIPQSQSNIVIINYLLKHNAIKRNKEGFYSVNFNNIKDVIRQFTAKIHKIQEEGSYNKAQELIDKYLIINDKLKTDLQKINNNNIPIDIRVKQGTKILGIE